MALRFDLSGNPISPHSTHRSFKTVVRNANDVAPLDSGIAQVTRAEYEALLARVNALEAANTVNKAVNKTANKVNTAIVVDTGRAGYMREYMRKRRAAKQEV